MWGQVDIKSPSFMPPVPLQRLLCPWTPCLQAKLGGAGSLITSLAPLFLRDLLPKVSYLSGARYLLHGEHPASCLPPSSPACESSYAVPIYVYPRLPKKTIVSSPPIARSSQLLVTGVILDIPLHLVCLHCLQILLCSA